MADEFLHIVDVVVEVEFAVGQRHIACIFPVGDIDLVVFEHGFDGVAQQRGVVPRQWRHDQHGGLAFEVRQRAQIVGKTLEAAQLAKRLVNFDALVNRQTDAIGID